MSEPNRVLVVDDNEPTRQLIARILTQELPVEVTLAGSAADAEHKMRETRFDVIVLDLLMPHASGFDVLEWMRKGESPNRDTPVLVVSVLGDAESIERCRKLGASVHIVKPILRETLAAAVRDHLSRPAPQGASKDARTDPGTH
jgi:DNA-binding response OmpR family regulator